MKRLIAAMLTATVLTLAACTDQLAIESSVDTTETATSTRDIVPTISTVATSQTMPASTSTTVSTTPAINTPAKPPGDIYDAIPVEIPDSITGDDLAAATEAIAVWRNAMRVFDESMQDPSAKDWKPDIYEFANDPAALKQLGLVGTFDHEKIHQVGHPSYTAVVVEAKKRHVTIRACVELNNYDVIDIEGDSVVKPGGLVRAQRDYWIALYSDPSVWYLNFIDLPDPAKPC